MTNEPECMDGLSGKERATSSCVTVTAVLLWKSGWLCSSSKFKGDSWAQCG